VLEALALGVLVLVVLTLVALLFVALALGTGTDVADTAAGKLGGLAAAAFVRLDARCSAATAKTIAITVIAATATISPRLYMAEGYGG
jgi:hypothetical protein